MRSLELARHLLETELARPGAGELIRRRELQKVCGLGATSKRLRAFARRFFPVGRRPGAIVGRSDPVGRGPRPHALGPPQSTVAAQVGVVVQIVQACECIAVLRGAISTLGLPIARGRRAQPRRSIFVPQSRHVLTVAGRAFPRSSAPVVGDGVAAGNEVVI